MFPQSNTGSYSKHTMINLYQRRSYTVSMKKQQIVFSEAVTLASRYVGAIQQWHVHNLTPIVTIYEKTWHMELVKIKFAIILYTNLTFTNSILKLTFLQVRDQSLPPFTRQTTFNSLVLQTYKGVATYVYSVSIYHTYIQLSHQTTLSFFNIYLYSTIVTSFQSGQSCSVMSQTSLELYYRKQELHCLRCSKDESI